MVGIMGEIDTLTWLAAHGVLLAFLIFLFHEKGFARCLKPFRCKRYQ